MTCPYCKKEAEINDAVKLNLEFYGGAVRARTRCCGKLVYVYPSISFSCRKTNQDGQDDWGE